MNEWSLDWKYGIFVDYVELRPMTKAEFDQRRNAQQNPTLENQPSSSREPNEDL